MNEIPFLEQLGDRLEAAIRTPSAARHRHGRGPRTPRGVALILAVALALTGGGVAAATLLSSSQKLADGQVNCFLASRGQGASALHLHLRGTGQSAIATCRSTYQHYPRSRIPAASLRLIACRQNATTVSVYIADGHADQCRRLGEQPLPGTYTAAVQRLHQLNVDLTRVVENRDCPSPNELAESARDTLASLGFDGWRVLAPGPRRWLQTPAGTGGTCASFIANSWDNSPSISTSQLPTAVTPSSRTISLTYGPPRHIAARLYRASTHLYQQTYQHCYTPTTARALIRDTFAGSGLQPRFTTTARPAGERYSGASETLYDRGCVRFETVYPGNDNHYADVWLYARSAHPLAAQRTYPPAAAFRP